MQTRQLPSARCMQNLVRNSSHYLINKIPSGITMLFKFINSQRSCSSQRVSSPTPLGSGGCWGRLPGGCLPPPLWRIERERSEQSTLQQRSVQKPPLKKRASERRARNCYLCLRFISCTYDPIAPWSWLDDLWTATSSSWCSLELEIDRPDPVAKLLRHSTQFLVQPWKPK